MRIEGCPVSAGINGMGCGINTVIAAEFAYAIQLDDRSSPDAGIANGATTTSVQVVEPAF